MVTLDWSDRSHWGGWVDQQWDRRKGEQGSAYHGRHVTVADRCPPCRLCGKPAHLRDSAGRPAHKVCVEALINGDPGS